MTDLELLTGLWTWERWLPDKSVPTILVGTIDLDHDDCEDDCVTLDVVDAPSGQQHWGFGVPKHYIVNRASLRPATPEEAITVEGDTQERVWRLEEELRLARRDLAAFKLCTEHAIEDQERRMGA